MAHGIIVQRPSAGDRFGRWTILGAAPSKFYFDKSKTRPSEHPRYFCQCDCGAKREVALMSLRKGISTSCGCFNRERSSAVHTLHGQSHSAEYEVWSAMCTRCRGKAGERSRKDYSGRGITVCDRWLSFDAFIEDMGPRPSPRHSLDRRNNNLGYSPENCRWAVSHVQMTNRRNTRFVAYLGELVPLATLAKQFNIAANTLRGRIVERGWSVERALRTPVMPQFRGRS